ncbi:MAG: McrC family protein [Acidimicrobiales bacterium]
MTDPIVLTEYESRDVTLSNAAVTALAAAAGDRLTVGLGATPGTWRLGATSWVGTVVTGDVEVLIRPKVPIDNVFVLLGVGLDLIAWGDTRFAYGRRPDLLAVVAAFYARAVDAAIGAGLVRSYRAEEERLVSVRGRIDLAAVIRRPGPMLPVACRFDEYTADNTENRVLKAGVRRLLRVPGVPAAVRRQLSMLRSAFDDVADVAATPAMADSVRFTRLNAHYEPAVRLARLVLAELTLSDEIGATAASTFLVDMNVLFERFLTVRLTAALAGQLEVVGQYGEQHLDRERTSPIRPDLVFRRNGRVVGVADVKYKLANDGTARRADQYQLLAYTTALDLSDGTLIYAQSTGTAPERAVTVRNAGKTLRSYPIDLTGSPAAIDTAVEALAETLAAHPSLTR